MKIATVDAKRRLVLPRVQPGDAFAIQEAEPGHFHLTKVIPAPCKTVRSDEEIDALLVSAALTPKMSWAQLSSLTREP